MFLLLCVLAVLTHSVIFPIGFYPNQIWYGTVLSVFGISLVYTGVNTRIFRGALRSGVPIYLYFLLLVLSACWAEFPEYTLDQMRFDWISILVYWLFYCFAMYSGYNTLRVFFISFPPLYFVFVMLYYIVLDTEASRLGDPLQVAIAIPFISASFVLGKDKWLTALSLSCALITIMISMKKMIIVSGMLGLIASPWIVYPYLRNPWRLGRWVLSLSVGILVGLIVLLEVPETRDHMLLSVSRFGYDVHYGDTHVAAEPADPLRERITEDSIELLKENWLTGMGYMNFMGWSAARYGIRYAQTTGEQAGREVYGVNLHNSFMTWALEGGIICVIIVGWIITKYYSIILGILKNSKDDTECLFVRAAAVAMLQLLAFGLFHQVHASLQLWLMIGIVYALKCFDYPGYPVPRYADERVFDSGLRGSS